MTFTLAPGNARLRSIVTDLDFLDDWDERYRYLIDLGRRLDPLPHEAYSEANRVPGCASQVWLLMSRNADGSLSIKGDSDALIVKGLVALVLAMFDGRPLAEVAGFDAAGFFATIGLKDHLTSQRANGLASMVARIKAEAAKG
ncbi:MAG: SufE family protein [Methylobacterium sp.]|jgi:cysteine desulfuration protein SufE|nr:SufE family protein [Methylobacterium sp.]MCA3603308.1 SufE family protein [Methylobacterium sp.]MCA3612865.1 SufE family protein [Methylobacterium sp.]MCA3614192.1 SufE family protein [Methylobacterium sp.]MCA3623956.1 SufE family protein [Methylobacterium sp.]